MGLWGPLAMLSLVLAYTKHPCSRCALQSTLHVTLPSSLLATQALTLC